MQTAKAGLVRSPLQTLGHETRCRAYATDPKQTERQHLAVHCVPLSSQRHLRSAERNLLHLPRHRLNTGTAAPRLCHCWAIRLEQSSGTCPQPKRHQNCVQTPATHFCSHRTTAPSDDALQRIDIDILRIRNWLVSTSSNTEC